VKSNIDSIYVKINKIRKRSSRKRTTNIERKLKGINEDGAVIEREEIEKGLNDCGHIGEAGALCAFCGSFSVCGACASSGKFACSSCGRTVCSKCAKASVFRPPNRFCPKCAPLGFLSLAFKKMG
jgi:hypothetical protein